MLDQQLQKELGISPEEIETEVDKAFKKYSPPILSKLYEESIKEFKADTILKGKIVDIIANKEVMIDVGYKSEGSVPISEFALPQEIKVGDEIEVYLESLENELGLVVLSKTKADHIRGWERIMSDCKEGTAVKGRVNRKIKGGLIVDIGVPAFLPASQVDIRRQNNLDNLINQQIDAKVIKVDPERMNIIISRRKYLEDQRASARNKLLNELKEGDVCSGLVKNIADYGVFVDLGGLDGLLHISDMSWKRVSHPSEIVALDQTIKVKILKIDPSSGRVALGLKQLSSDPWKKVNEKYPVNTRVKGKVANLVPYGAFLELEPGVEGLLHISEISWTKRVAHPSEVMTIGDIVEGIVLSANADKQELALGMKQLEVNPWSQLEKKYTPGMRIQGRVRNLTSYGAFIEIEESIDGLLHISDMSWTKGFTKPAEIVKRGDKIEAVILSIEPEKKRVALGLKQLIPNPWETIILEKYDVGTVIEGKVTRLTATGAYIELEPDIIGFLSLSKPVGAKDKTKSKERLTPTSEKEEPSVPKEPAPAEPPSDKTETQTAYRPKVDDMVTVEVVKLNPAEGYIGLKLVQASDSSRGDVKEPEPQDNTTTLEEEPSPNNEGQKIEDKEPDA